MTIPSLNNKLTPKLKSGGYLDSKFTENELKPHKHYLFFCNNVYSLVMYKENVRVSIEFRPKIYELSLFQAQQIRKEFTKK